MAALRAQQLEEDLGFRLFDRSRGRVSPTPEAMRLHTEIEKAFTGIERVVATARDIGNIAAGSLRVAAVPSLAQGILREVLGEAPGPRQANVAPSYRGRMCWAGVDYFAVDKTGEAWSCRTAKRHGEGHLGNIYDGSLARLAAPSACPWDICPCTVPANRGMIEGVEPSVAT